MRAGEILSVVQKPFLYEVCGEVANVVFADTFANKAQLFQMAASCDLVGVLVPEVREHGVEICVERSGKIHAQSASAIAFPRETKPRLFYLRELKPRPQQPLGDPAGYGLVA